MIKFLSGDLFSSKKDVLVNAVNCVGVMGAGIAKIFKERYPEMFEDYVKKCEQNVVQLGKPYLFPDVEVLPQFEVKRILNFPTVQHWSTPAKLDDISAGLDYLLGHYKEWGIKSIAFPALGCGVGGLSWDVVSKLMYEKLAKSELDVEIYAPLGTSIEDLEL